MNKIIKCVALTLALIISVFALTGCGDTGTMLLNVDAKIRWEINGKFLYVSPEITNYNKRTGEAVEIFIYACDKFGNNLYGENGYQSFVVDDLNLKTDCKTYTDWLILDGVASSAATLYIKVNQARFTDGTIRSGNSDYKVYQIK